RFRGKFCFFYKGLNSSLRNSIYSRWDNYHFFHNCYQLLNLAGGSYKPSDHSTSSSTFLAASNVLFASVRLISKSSGNAISPLSLNSFVFLESWRNPIGVTPAIAEMASFLSETLSVLYR